MRYQNTAWKDEYTNTFMKFCIYETSFEKRQKQLAKVNFFIIFPLPPRVSSKISTGL